MEETADRIPWAHMEEILLGPRNPSVYSLFLLLFFLLKGKKRKDGPEDVEIKSEI